MELRAVLFDLWGTLIEDPDQRSRPRQLWRAENVRALLATAGCDLSLEAVDSSLVAAGAALSTLHDGGLDVSAAGRVDLWARHLPVSVELSASSRAALEAAITTMHPVHRPQPAEGALELLRHVKEMGLATALVSNAGLTTAPQLRIMLAEFGMAPYLDACIFSDDHELAKPNYRLFQAALDQIGVEASTAAFVGDSPHNDVYGARQAGMLAVQIGHRVAPPSTGYTRNDAAVPDARIGTLAELLPALGRLATFAQPGL